MKGITNFLLALSLTVLAGVALSACDDSDSSSSSTFTIQNGG